MKRCMKYRNLILSLTLLLAALMLLLSVAAIVPALEPDRRFPGIGLAVFCGLCFSCVCVKHLVFDTLSACSLWL